MVTKSCMDAVRRWYNTNLDGTVQPDRSKLDAFIMSPRNVRLGDSCCPFSPTFFSRVYDLHHIDWAKFETVYL